MSKRQDTDDLRRFTEKTRPRRSASVWIVR